MANAVNAEAVEIIAVDNSEAMVARCRQNLTENAAGIHVEVRLENILDTRIENASVVVLNFTLQFLDRGQRQGLIDRIAHGMCEGGALIISEKICFDDAREQTDQTNWHHDFKRSQGYSDLEIAQKRNALEDVLQPDTEHRHIERLRQSGLNNPSRWFQCFSFASYIAFK
jgi:tRNA (cmo5U34)-methyltransferase